MTLKYVIIGAITATLMISGITSMVQPVVAGDANCETDPDDPRCTGEKGAGGMNFCVPGDRFGDCYDADFSTIDCDVHQNHSRCTGSQGRDGNIFCDIQYEDLGYYDNCYDRKDTPKWYCDNYAKEESDRWYTAEFCQSVCNNYEDVITKDDPCE